MPRKVVRRALLPLLALVYCATGRAAEPQTGGELAAACRDRESPGPCINYLLNAVDGHAAFAKWGAIATQWCMPELGYEKLRAEYLAYFDTHPALATQPANEAVVAAYAATHPCPQESAREE